MVVSVDTEGESVGSRLGRSASVLHLSVSGTRIGGAEVQYELLLTALHRQGQPVCAVFPDHGDLSTALRSEGIPTLVCPLPRVRRLPRLGRRVAPEALVAFASDRRAQLVHCELKLAPYAFDLRRRLGIPVVLHVRRGVRRKSVRRLRPGAADAVVAIGERFRDELTRLGLDAQGIDIIRDATDLARFRPHRGARNVLEREFPAAGPLRLGVVGRIEPSKRQLEVVEMLGPLLRRRADLGLFLIGDAGFAGRDYREQLTRAASKLPAGRVIATGKRSDMPEVLHSLDLLVTLSGGSVMVEAMACGVPVVSMSDRPPASLHIVRHRESGWVVPEGDRALLEQAVEQLADDPCLRRRLGAAGRRRAERFFGAERLVRETQAVYARVLRSTGERAAASR